MSIKKIDKGLRCTNYMIDYMIVIVLWMVIKAIFNNVGLDAVLFYVLTFFYYLISESIFKQTLGKRFTKTEVVKKDGSLASFGNILIRSITRLIPIDAFSYLFGTERGLHDVLSKTKLTFKNSKID